MARLPFASLLLVLCGCAALDARMVSRLQDISSGHIGCPPEAIGIPARSPTAETWTATCEGRTFYCSAYGGDSSVISCAPALSQQ